MKKPPRSKLEQLIRDKRLPGYKTRAQLEREADEKARAELAEATATKKAERERLQRVAEEAKAGADAWGQKQIADGLRERHEAFLLRKRGDTG